MGRGLELVSYLSDSDSDVQTEGEGREKYSRRDALRGMGALGAAAVTGDFSLLDSAEEYTSGGYAERGDGVVNDAADVPENWGAMYFPSDAYNTWQMWEEYDPKETDRDFEYADALNLNSLRVFLNYEHWRDNPGVHESKFEDMLGTAGKYDIQIMPVFYEGLGWEPTEENLKDKDITTANAVQSPSEDYFFGDPPKDERLPTEFTETMAERYGDHPQVMALEIMNEPVGLNKLGAEKFTKEQLDVARNVTDAPLTVGCRELEYNSRFDVDIYQFHENLPYNQDALERVLDKAENFAKKNGDKQIILGEAQRTMEPCPREEKFPEPYWEEYRKDPENSLLHRMFPHYESIAPTIRERMQNSDNLAGNYLWGLVAKEAYNLPVRKKGRFNGIVWGDDEGAVYSLADAEAIAGEPVDFEEKLEAPDGMPQFIT